MSRPFLMGPADVSGFVARTVVRSLARFYYPQIVIDGGERIPRSGPVLLAANHPNSLLDPVLVGVAARRPVRLLAKAPLFKVPVFGAVLRGLGMIPAYRGRDNPREVAKNVESLASAARALASGSVVGIFPEGKSHDDPKVALVRSGAARLAVQAVAAGAAGLKLVPIGLNYERKERFRSAVWISIGEPIDVQAWVAEHADEHLAMRTLTAELDARLKRVVVHLEDPAWEPLLHEIDGLLPAPRRRQAPATLRLRKQVADALNEAHATGDAEALALAARIDAHRQRRERSGLPPAARFFRDPLLRRLAALVRDAAGLLVLSVAGAAGLVHHALPHAITRLLVGRLQEPGRMTLALYRLLIGLPVHGLWYAFIGWILLKIFQPWVAVLWLCAMPFAGLAAVDAVRRWRRFSPVWLAEVKLWFRRGEAEALRTSHRELATALTGLASRYPNVGYIGAPSGLRLLRPPLWLTATLGAAAIALVAGVGTWLLRDRPVEFWRTDGPVLHTHTAIELQAELGADERELVAILDGLEQLEARYRRFEAALATGDRSYYRPDDEAEIRRMLVTFLSFRSALLRITWKYQRYAPINDSTLRLRALLLHYTAAAVAYDYSARFVLAFEGKEQAQRKLNEAEPRWDLAPGTYDRIRANLANLSHRRWLEAGWKNYGVTLPEWTAHGIGPEAVGPAARFHQAIGIAAVNTAGLSARLWGYKLATAGAEVAQVADGGFYHASAAISTLIGDARLRAPRDGRPLVTQDLLDRLRPVLRPGDILIERRNWYLSNAFLPGYWPHAALYVGTADDLRALGLDNDPRVASHLARFSESDDAGHRFAVIEAVSEGVIFTSLEHSAGEADAVAVLRPKLPQDDIREAIARAFSHAGKPYDFDFDFFSSDRLVCTEVVHRSYAGRIDFPLADILGRKTLPALDIVRYWANGAATGNGSLEFVALLDGDETSGTCRWSDAETLRESIDRPALTWLN